MSAGESVQVTFAGVGASVLDARTFVRRTLGTWGLDALVETASLVVSELATNAVLHARSPFTVRLSLDASGGFAVEVVDRSSRPPAVRRGSTAGTTGRGLAIVAQLATAWGVEERPEGKAVWARLEAATGRTGAPPGRPVTGPGPRRRPARPDGPVALAG